MSAPPPGRALAFPIAWSKRQEERSVAAPNALEETDQEVMARLQSNDPNALEVLFGRYSRLVLSVALGIVRDAGEAEDVVQEAFFYLYQFVEESSFVRPRF